MFKRIAKLFAEFFKKEDTVSEPLNDQTAVNQVAVADPSTVAPVAPVVPAIPDAASIVAPAVANQVVSVKTGVADFEAALQYVEAGVKILGEAAKDELVALAKKYL